MQQHHQLAKIGANNVTKAYFKHAKRQEPLPDSLNIYKEQASIIKSDQINPSTELSRMRQIYEYGEGLIDVNTLLISQDSNKELLLLAKFIS